MGTRLLRSARERLRPGRADQLRRRDAAHGHVDQLLRAARGGFGLTHGGRQAWNLRRSAGGRGNHAPWRGGRLRFLVDPPEGRAGARDQQQRERPGVLHARVRPELRDGGVGRRAPRRADGDTPLRSPGHRRVHPRQGPGRSAQLQCERGGHRRVHARSGSRRRMGTGAQNGARPRVGTRAGTSARRWEMGLSHDQGSRSVAADHELHVRSRRARGGLHRSRQHRRQPCRTARASRPPIPALQQMPG